MASYVKIEQDKWFAKYEEQLASWKAQQGSSKRLAIMLNQLIGR